MNHTLLCIAGKYYKTKRVRICEEMPAIRLRQKAWFLHEARADGWEYLGYFDTFKAVESYIDASR